MRNDTILLIIGLLTAVVGIILLALNLIGENSRIIGTAVVGIGILVLLLSHRSTGKAK